MDKINEIRLKKAKAVERMRALLDLCETETRDMVEAEQKEYDALDASLEKFDKDITREERLAEQEAALSLPANRPHVVRTKPKEDPAEFSCLGEFIHSVAMNRNDRRLQNVEYRDQEMGTGSAGGFAVPEKFKPELLQVAAQPAALRPRCTVLPATAPPDAKITMPALDQTAAANMYGGVIVYKVAEGATLTETTAALKEVSLEPNALGAYVNLTNKLLRNWQGSSNVISGLLSKAMIGYEETQFLSGNGVAGPTGVTVAGATVLYSRSVASTIVTADINGMITRFKFGGNPIWIASQTTLPQLLKLFEIGTYQQNLFMFDYRQGIPATLLGYPLIFHDRSPALGTTGDLALLDMQYYLVQDGSGPFVSASEHVSFTADKTVIKIIWNVDGKPWLTAPIPLEGATSNTVSPFVVLKSI
jgi:HK97 family phage major capsid protein